MKYVKLIARPNTWFKEGTEAYDYNCNPPKTKYRIVVNDEWREMLEYGYGCLRGIRIDEDGENWDGECCQLEEFDWEIVDDPC